MKATYKRHTKGIGFLVFALIAMLASFTLSYGQGEKHVMQLSGIILGEDSTASSGIPGVHIYVAKAGRGTTSNRVGYFSMPVLPGDELTISAIGYENQYYRVPDSDKDNMTIVVELVSDVTYLDAVEILPFPTEEIFKEAVLALNVPIDDGVNNANLNEELLALMLRSTPMDGTMNFRYSMDNWAQAQNDRFSIRQNPFLNVFNWANFFKSLKKKKKKK